jgi:hypothetical protein
MARAAAPYVHAKIQSTAPSTDDGSPVRPVINLTINRGPAGFLPGSDKQAALEGIKNFALKKLN